MCGIFPSDRPTSLLVLKINLANGGRWLYKCAFHHLNPLKLITVYIYIYIYYLFKNVNVLFNRWLETNTLIIFWINLVRFFFFQRELRTAAASADKDGELMLEIAEFSSSPITKYENQWYKLSSDDIALTNLMLCWIWRPSKIIIQRWCVGSVADLNI